MTERTNGGGKPRAGKSLRCCDGPAKKHANHFENFCSEYPKHTMPSCSTRPSLIVSHRNQLWCRILPLGVWSVDKSININQEPVRNIESQSLSQKCWISNWILTSSPGKLHSHYSQGSTDVKETSLGLERSRPWSCHLLFEISIVFSTKLGNIHWLAVS